MKGFPNQIAKIEKLTVALSILSELLTTGGSSDDKSFGESLLWGGVIRAGRSGGDIATYIDHMNTLSPSNQSHRTTARGVKEFFVRVGVVCRTVDSFYLTDSGHRILESWESGNHIAPNQDWKRAMRNATSVDDDGVSHPYRIMLKLLAQRPGTPRALCALALEAKNDSESEFQRILYLRDLEDEDAMRTEIGATRSNWDNAKKILPSIAEQIGDVARSGSELYLVDAEELDSAYPDDIDTDDSRTLSIARETSLDKIARWHQPETTDEETQLENLDLVSLAEGIKTRVERSARHNQIVRRFAQSLINPESIWENPVDCMALFSGNILMAEIKTLTGTFSDEMRQVRIAASQLQYYEYFAIPASLQQQSTEIQKVAVFERRPQGDHIDWLDSLRMATLWTDEQVFRTTENSFGRLSPYIILSSA